MARVRPVSGRRAERTDIIPQDRAEDSSVSGFQSMTHVHLLTLSILQTEAAGVTAVVPAGGRDISTGGAAGRAGSRDESLRGGHTRSYGFPFVAMLLQ